MARPHVYLTFFTETNVFCEKAFEHGTAHSVAEFSGSVNTMCARRKAACLGHPLQLVGSPVGRRRSRGIGMVLVKGGQHESRNSWIW